MKSLYRTFFTKPAEEAAIVIPIHKESVEEFEQVSFQQCLKMLGHYPILIAAPEKINIQNFLKNAIDGKMELLKNTNISTIYFKDEDLANAKAYNKLLITSKFYKKFLDYKFILIYQLDVFVFSDQLTEWCAEGWDYVGAPWINSQWMENIKKYFPSAWKVAKDDNVVGNGGFSLRKVRTFLKILYLLQPLVIYFNKRVSKDLFHEDFFWSLYVPLFYKSFKVPDYRKALEFGFELQPSKCYQLNNNQLPFGCHAWQLHETEFWLPFIKSFEYNLKIKNARHPTAPFSERKIKVLHINTFDYYGGASQVAFQLMQYTHADSKLLVRRKETKNENVIQFKENFLDKLFLILDKIIWKLGIKKPFRKVFGMSDELHATYKKLKRLKEYREANIIHLHNIHGNYFDLSALRKIADDKYIVWTLHDMWAMTGGEAYTFYDENYKKGIGKTPHIKVYPLENPLIDRRQHFIDLKKKMYKEISSKITFVPVSNWLANCLKEAYVYNEEMKVRVIHNGIDFSQFKNEVKRDWPKPRVLFFHIAGAYKGNELFKEVVDKIEVDFELTIAGHPLSIKKKYTHIPYIDSRSKLNDIYNSVDFLIFPSRAESFPLTLIEALRCGASIIASDAGGNTEILDPSSFYIFKNGDKEDLLNKANYALHNLSASRSKAEEASLNIQNFSIEQCADKYLSLYKEALKYNNGIPELKASSLG